MYGRLARIVLLGLLTICAIVTAFALANRRPKTVTPTPEQIMNTVVVVNEASGIVVYSDAQMALILTVFHVIDDFYEPETNTIGGELEIARHFGYSPHPIHEQYAIDDCKIDNINDLALVQVEGAFLPFATVILKNKDPKLGDDIWLAGNPLGRYRTLVKGNISNQHHRFNRHNQPQWQVSGGIVPGASGGGAFTMSGELFGIIDSVAQYKSDDCWQDEEGKVECQMILVPYMGYIMPPKVIRHFLTTGKFSEYFEYLK